MTQTNAVRLWLGGARNVHTIALESGISVRQVQRQLIAAGLREKHVFVPPKDEALVIERVSEGMPVTWAIEGTDVNYNRGCHLASQVPNRAELTLEWQRCWQKIRVNEELLLEHWDIAPPSSHVHYNLANAA